MTSKAEEHRLIGKEGIVQIKDATKKLTIRGETKRYPIYQIPLEYLFYNDQNGRIATYMNEVEGEISIHGDIERYNAVVHQFIIDSNPSAFEKTKKNIKDSTQKHPAVVLSDGRVIDGNRRFTCLRQLTKELNKEHFLEAVILDKSEGLSEKDIKTLELNLQQAEDKPVDYNPIDNLVDVYRDLIKNEMFTEQEYAQHRDQKLSEVRRDKEVAQLMVDFLEFIDAPEKFHLARKMNLDGPLREMPRILKKFDDEAQKSLVKDSLFAVLLTKQDGDLTRYIRDLGKLVLSDPQRLAKFLDQYEDVVENVYDTVEARETPISTLEDLGETVKESGIKEESLEILDDHLEDARTADAKSQPVDLLVKTIRQAEQIDRVAIQYMDEQTRFDFIEKLKELNTVMKKLNDSAGLEV